MDDLQVPIPPRLDGDQLSAYVIEAQRIADEAMLGELEHMQTIMVFL